MRIYIPLILSDLAAEQIDVRRVHAVTPALRAAVPDEDAEGYEYMATLAAADDSLRLIGQNPDTYPRRLVALAEVPERAIAGDEDAFMATGDIELLWFDITERLRLTDH